jgi:hypothetical protein
VAIVGVAVAVFATLPDLVSAIRGDSDAMAAVALAQQTLDTPGPDGMALTGDHAWFIGFWAVLTLDWAGMPFEAIVALPAVMWLAMTAGIARYWYRESGVLAAVVAAAVLLSLGRAAWVMVGTWDGRSGTIFLTVAAVLLLTAASRPETRPGWRVGGLVAAGVAAGVATGSDALGVLTTVVPLLVAGAVVRDDVQGRSWTVFGWLAGGVAVGYGGSAVLARLTGLVTAEFPLTIRPDPLDGISALYGSGSFVWSDMRLFNDNLGLAVGVHLAAFLAGWAIVILVIWVLYGVMRERFRPARTPASGHTVDRLAIWCAYWGTATVLLPVSFLATSVSDIDGANFAVGRYLIPWWVAIAALVPLVLRSRVVHLRQLTLILVAALVCINGGRLVKNAVQSAVKPGAPAYVSGVPRWWADGVQRVAKQWRATHGYSGYWTSFPLGTGDGDVPVYPLMTCGLAPAPQYCASKIASRPSMYRTNRGRSFVVLDNRPNAPDHAVVDLKGISMKPLTVVAVAPQITMVVFPGDIGRYVSPAFGQSVQNGR